MTHLYLCASSGNITGGVVIKRENGYPFGRTFRCSELLSFSFFLLQMPSIAVEDQIPEGTFKYVPYTPEQEDHVGILS